MAVSRGRWNAARDRYQAHTAAADELAEEAVSALEGDKDTDGDPDEAQVWATLALTRRLEAIGELFLDFMEPERNRARGDE